MLGSEAAPTGLLIQIIRIDPNLQRNIPTGISPSPPAQDLSFSSGNAGAERWREELFPATSTLSASMTASNLKPTHQYRWVGRVKGIFFLWPHSKELFFPNLCLLNVLAALQCSALHGSFILHTSYIRIITGLHAGILDEGHVYFCLFFFAVMNMP